MDLFTPLQANLLPFDGEVHYYGPLFGRQKSAKYMQRLLSTDHLKPDELIMFGKKLTTKRETAWFGDAGVSYTYSGIERVALPWTDELLEIKGEIETRTEETYNSCLLNYYHDGTEGLGWHADDEPELGSTPVIASLSLGAARKFAFKHNASKATVSQLLNDGDLLLMKGKTQQYWKHALPKSSLVKQPRLNLTFRTVIR